MELCCDDRVFMCDVREYGTVSRTGVLGIKKTGSYAVTSDSGKKYLYIGTPTEHIVCCKASMNNCGARFVLPLDLKQIGSSILEDAGVPPTKRSALYVAFSKMSDEDHEEYREAYSAISGSAEKTKTFVLDIYKKLVLD